VKVRPAVAITSYLKKRVLVQDRGESEIKTTGILKYSEDFNFAFNKDIGTKNFFEIACIVFGILGWT
jgi:hypothetical protein